MAVREQRDIEWLISWALIDNGLGSAFDGGKLKLDWTDYGTTIQTSGRWAVSGPKVQHDDALVIAEAIGLLHPECAALVLAHGKVGGQPDWVEEGVGELRQMVDGRGRLLWNWSVPGDYRSDRTPRLEWVGETRDSVTFYRAQYALWWIGLHDLVAPLNEVMEKHCATGPRALDEPWAGEPRRVFDARGRERTELLSSQSAARLSALRRRGDVEIASPAAVNIHRSGSAIR